MRRPRWIPAALAALAAGAGLLAFSIRTPRGAEPPSSESLTLDVDLSERTLSAVSHGEVIATYPVTVGSRRHPTPTGSYRIDWIVWNPSWNPPSSEWARGQKRIGPGPANPMGRVKMFFRRPAYYIHGTIESEEIGEAASHGCIRMLNGDVIELARVVMEHGGETRSPGWFKRLIDRFRDTREVTLSRPVPVRIRG